ncbi:hypothetical protein [Geotalea toluenoxydans]|uniref:hypothetical protein n=1 Tax=Geotalea toluenoxydans TaxID=421624 RepID=UPI0006D20770|nr:hypothetical protein [Geotalea toluenoxydans]
MIHAKRNLTTLLVVSLLVAVISLPGTISLAAAVAPVAKAMPPVRDGMMTPARILVESSGNNYYVTDPRAGAVLKYNLYGHLVQTIKTTGIPLGIAFAGSDLLVTCGNYVSVVNPGTGAEVRRIGEGVVTKATGVAVDSLGSTYVADAAKHQVHVFAASGVYVRSFGGLGKTVGFFQFPAGLAYDKDLNRLAVADSMNGRVQLFDVNPSNPTYLTNVKTIGLGTLRDQPLDFVAPQGVSFEYDKAGKLKRMYVVDTWKSGIQVIDPLDGVNGKYLSLVGAGAISAGSYIYGMLNGVQDWQFLLPSDAAFDPVYSRLLVPSANSSIQIIGIDGGMTPSDNNPIYLNINASPLNTNSSNYAISGTVKPGSQIKITTNTGAIAGLVEPVGQVWNATITGLALGVNKITVLATDVTGKELSKEINVLYTLNAPSLTVTTATGKVVNGLSTTLSGTVDADCTVNITNNTTGIASTAVVTGTSWTGTVTLSNNAANNFTVTASKPGSITASASVTIISDTTSPSLNISALPDNSYSSGTMTQNISGYVQDANPSTVSVSVNGGAATIYSTPLPAASFSASVTLQQGANTITVQATDLAGNTSFVNTRTINYQPTRPVLTLGVATPADNSFTNSATVSVSGTVTPVNSVVTITNNGVVVAGVTNDAAGNWSAPVTGLPLVNGQNVIVISANAGAGDASLKRTVTLDTTVPGLAITSPAADISINDPSIEIAGTVSADAGGYPTLTAMVNSTPVTPTLTNGTFVLYPGAYLAAGPNTIKVTATDSANNPPVTQVRNINYDITPPALTLGSTYAGYPKTISGTVESQASITVKDGATSFPVVVTAGQWTANLSSASYSRDTLQIKATDAAGNISVITGLSSSYTKPSGDLNADAIVNTVDVQLALDFAYGRKVPTQEQLLQGDIGPLLNGFANPNGVIDLSDAILIRKKAVDSTFTW